MNEAVILVDDLGQPVALADRRRVHRTWTPRHRGFSTYLWDDQDRVLLTRRALTKRPWPGVWTNSCCGHPRPGERLAQAAVRRIEAELGAQATQVRVILPDFSYQACDASGIMEYEQCPVLAARVDPNQLNPDPDEVMDLTWVRWPQLCQIAHQTPFLLSPWAVSQIRQLGWVKPV